LSAIPITLLTEFEILVEKMIKTIADTFAKSFVIAVVICAIQALFGISFVREFMQNNLLNILVTLMAINTATIAVILSKMYEISREHQKTVNETFGATKSQILLSIREQVALIGSGLIFSILSKKIDWSWNPTIINASLEILLLTVFIYALFILYDTAKAVLEFYQ